MTTTSSMETKLWTSELSAKMQGVTESEKTSIDISTLPATVAKAECSRCTGELNAEQQKHSFLYSLASSLPGNVRLYCPAHITLFLSYRRIAIGALILSSFFNLSKVIFAIDLIYSTISSVFSLFDCLFVVILAYAVHFETFFEVACINALLLVASTAVGWVNIPKLKCENIRQSKIGSSTLECDQLRDRAFWVVTGGFSINAIFVAIMFYCAWKIRKECLSL